MTDRLRLYTIRSMGKYLPALMIVVAKDEEQAHELLREDGINESWDFKEIDLNQSAVHVLDDGDY